MLLLAGSALALPACSSLGYLAHLSAGQVNLLLDREPLDAERIASLSDEERRGVRAVEQALGIADALGLAPSRSYRQIVDRGGEPLITLVIAAPADRLEPITWWFPISGRVPYRGYFDPARAAAFADGLTAQGYDTYVRPAFAYSTLGWFDDPIPRALLRLDPVLLIDTIVHERVHETSFVPGDGAYNEALASFVAHAATLAWLADDPPARERTRRSFADQRRFAALLERLAAELERLYARTSGPDEARRLREEVFARYQGEAFAAVDWQTDDYAGFPELSLSNAFLVAQETYAGALPCLERELSELGGDLQALVERHRADPGRGHFAEGCDAATSRAQP